MTKKLKITILTGNDELNISLKNYIRFVLTNMISQIYIAKLGKPETINVSMLDSDIWIIEAFNPEDPTNPEGFRTAKKLASRTKSLLLFVDMPYEDFFKNCKFCLKLPSEIRLKKKIIEIINSPKPTINDFETLENACPRLKKQPSHHHRRQENG